MCATIADGSADAVICSADFAKIYTTKPLFIAASVLRVTAPEPTPDKPELQARIASEAYVRAGMGPADIDVWEIGDPITDNEIMSYEQVGMCAKGESPSLIEGNETSLTGKHPVNSAGGHEGRGHPTAATGVAQITELVWHLRGEVVERQIANQPKAGFVQIYGGDLRPEPAACATTIIKL